MKKVKLHFFGELLGVYTSTTMAARPDFKGTYWRLKPILSHCGAQKKAARYTNAVHNKSKAHHQFFKSENVDVNVNEYTGASETD